MKRRTIKPTQLTPVCSGSFFSHELSGDNIVVRLFGLIPISTIHLGAVYYLRLATRREVSPLYFIFNWPQFLAHRRARRPVYVLQTRKGHRYFLKLEGDTHFKLRQAIGRHSDRKRHQKLAA